MKSFRKTRKLLLITFVFLAGLTVGTITTYLVVGDFVIKNMLYTDEAKRSIEILMHMRSKHLEQESLYLESRLQELLVYLKTPLFSNGSDHIEIAKLSESRLLVFQAAKEYYADFGWRNAYSQRLSGDLKGYLDDIPWSPRRQKIIDWNAKYKGATPQQAPGLDTEMWIGEVTPLDSLRGKVVLLDFWGIRCGGCLDALPQLQSLHEKYQSKGLHIITIHSQYPYEDQAKAHISKEGYTFTVCLGRNHKYLIRGLPTYYLIDKKGDLIWGPSHELPSQIYIKDLLGMAVENNEEKGDGS